MIYLKEDFIDDVNEFLALCEQEVEKRKQGIDGEATLEQLTEMIIPEMKELLINIEKRLLPTKSKRYLVSFAYAFKVWSWDMRYPTELYMKLNDLDNHYSMLSVND